MLKRSHYIALSFVVMLTLVILNLPGQSAARLKLGISSLFLPLFGLASSTQQLAGKAADATLPRRQLIQQNEALRRENQQLKIQLQEASEMARENIRLRQLFAWQQRSNRKVKLANVVLREPANWWRSVQIDLGSRDGMQTNLPVLSVDGHLLGRINSVGYTRSQVVLLGDPSCKVSALVENEARDTGVIGSSGPIETTLVEMSRLSRNVTLRPGQNVVTSGLGGVFPRNIPIGKVVDSHLVEYGLYMVARVRLSANLGALEEVWVLMP